MAPARGRQSLPGSVAAPEGAFESDADATERRNLAGDPAHEAVKRDLKDRLLERIVLQDHPYPPRDRIAVGMP